MSQEANIVAIQVCDDAQFDLLQFSTRLIERTIERALGS